MKINFSGAALLAIGLILVSSTQSDARTIRTQSAVYYAGDRSCGYTKRVVRKCDGMQRCNFACTNWHTCGDPARGVTKNCLITYKCSGRKLLRYGRSVEGAPTKLRCP
jgi:hypothetical protein